MSGPKCYEYRVDPAVLAAQQEAARLQEQARQLEARRARAVAQHAQAAAELGAAIPAMAALPATGATQASHTALERALEHAEQTLTAAVQAARFEQFSAVISAGIAAPREKTARAQAADRLRLRAEEEDAQAEVRASAARVAARLDLAASADESRRIAELVAAIQPNDPQAEARLDLLRAAVAEINGGHRAAADRAQGVDEALTALAAVSHGDVSAVRARLHTARTGQGPLPAELSARVARLVEEAHAEAERAYVAQALREAFTDLGYDVGEQFTTVLEANGVADIATSWEGYRVRVRRQPPGRSVLLNVVRGQGDASAEDDRAVEAAICEAYPHITDQLSASGIRFDRTRALEAGAVRVQVDSTLPAVPAAAERTKSAERERPRDEPRLRERRR